MNRHISHVVFPQRVGQRRGRQGLHMVLVVLGYAFGIPFALLFLWFLIVLLFSLPG